MSEKISQEECLEELLMSLKSMNVIPSVGTTAFSDMLERMAQHINEVILSNFNILLALLYRVDVDESKVREELINANKEETAGHIIARLIIDRQNEKLKWRKKFSK